MRATLINTFGLGLGLIVLVGCGGGRGGSSTTVNAVPPGDDRQGLVATEAELLDLGVSVGDPIYSMSNVTRMVAKTLARTRALLVTLKRHARALVQSAGPANAGTTEAKPIARARGLIEPAEVLIANITRIQNRAEAKAYCAGVDARSFTAIARRGASAFVRGLDPAIAARVDGDAAPAVTPVAGSCTRTRVTFRDRNRPTCALAVVMDQGTVVHDQSDAAFVCR